MNELKDNWVIVPEQISLIGVGDCSFANISSPRLSSFRIPFRDMGIMAVRQVRELTEKKSSASMKVMLRAELVERDSVKEIGSVQKDFFDT